MSGVTAADGFISRQTVASVKRSRTEKDVCVIVACLFATTSNQKRREKEMNKSLMCRGLSDGVLAPPRRPHNR